MAFVTHVIIYDTPRIDEMTYPVNVLDNNVTGDILYTNTNTGIDKAVMKKIEADNNSIQSIFEYFFMTHNLKKYPDRENKSLSGYQIHTSCGFDSIRNWWLLRPSHDTESPWLWRSWVPKRIACGSNIWSVWPYPLRQDKYTDISTRGQ